MKPPEVFDREQEWSDLERFLADPSPGLHLGIVSGRRRVGKSYLLRRLARTGIYHQAIEEDRAPALRRVAELVAIRRGLPSGTVAFDDWLPAFDALLGPYPGSDRPSVVVIDELPYLVARSPELLSVLQRAVDERVDGPPQALVLCGSALAVMTSLLSGSQPLRGRARLDLRMEPFDFRVARKFWGVPDAATAFAVHAIIGGAAGYFDLVGRRVPRRSSELAEFLADTVLNPSHALYREDEFLLREDPRLQDRALYQSILSAVAAGERTPARIAARLGRDRTSLSALLSQLVEAGFLHREVDVANSRGVQYLVADPMLRFDRLIVAPNRADLDERRPGEVWQRCAPTWQSQILGPHAEEVARTWLHRYADEETTGGRPARIGRRVLSDRSGRTTLELDAVGLDERGAALFVAEVKGGTAARTTDDITRLERARTILGAEGAKLLLIALGGFDRSLRALARRRGDVELVDVERLYGGG
ncbi:MAG: ATP-binding protein [Acidimicrobiia bacterium]